MWLRLVAVLVLVWCVLMLLAAASQLAPAFPTFLAGWRWWRGQRRRARRYGLGPQVASWV